MAAADRVAGYRGTGHYQGSIKSELCFGVKLDGQCSCSLRGNWLVHKFAAIPQATLSLQNYGISTQAA